LSFDKLSFSIQNRLNHLAERVAQFINLAFLVCFLGMTVSLVFYAFSQKERRKG